MKHLIVVLILCSVILGGCSAVDNEQIKNNLADVNKWQDAPEGSIGDDFSVTRAQAAKMMALAFFTSEELEKLPKQIEFADVSDNSWYAPFVNGAVSMGFLLGDDLGFHPEAPLTLQQTQVLLEKLHPTHKTKINITEATKNKAVSYTLWMQVFQDALKQRRGEDSLYSYGIVPKTIVPIEKNEKGFLAADGLYSAKGTDLAPYLYKEITVLCKNNEIVALISVDDINPIIKNVYCQTNTNGVTIQTGDGEAVIPWIEENIQPEGICTIALNEGLVENITAAPNIGRVVIKKVGNDGLELEGMGNAEWDENASVYEKTENEILRRPISRLVCGTDIAEIYITDNKINGAVIVATAKPDDIRVVLSSKEGYIHQQVQITSDDGFSVTNGSNGITYKPNDILTLPNDEAVLSLFTTGRVYIKSDANKPLIVKSITKDGQNPRYLGSIEVEKTADGYRLINQLPLEKYLYGVVPGEMPISFGIEALKVQAVAARSYVYNQFYANRYGDMGAHVDDTTSTQVYIGGEGKELSNQAIDETKGVCLTYGNKVIVANFYSSTCGYSADAGEVWRDARKQFPGEGKPYLKADSQGLTKDYGDLSAEANAAAFFKDQNVECYDAESPYVRWQSEILANDFVQIVNRGAKLLFNQKAGLIKVYDNEKWQENIEPPVFNAIKDITVTKRGKGGIIMNLEITGDNGKIQLETENAIRRALAPSMSDNGKNIAVKLKDNSQRYNMSLLPSAFFVAETTKADNGNITSIKLYGGGNGHGVGMSQYGARGMALRGFGYQDILAHYFKDGNAQKVIE